MNSIFEFEQQRPPMHQPQPSTSHQPPKNSQKGFLTQCYAVIREQQDYIGTLEANILRKDSIINDLLIKANRSPHKPLMAPMQKNNPEVMELEINQLNHQVQYLSHQNQCLRITMQAKEKEMLALQSKLAEKESNLQEGRQMLDELKRVYQAKISKLLAELKHRVTESVSASRQRAMHRPLETFTPIKMLRKMPEQMADITNRMASKSMQKTAHSTGRKTLLNSPYLQSNYLDRQTGRYRTETDESEVSFAEEESALNNVNLFGKAGDGEVKKVGIKKMLEELGAKMNKFIDSDE